MSDQRNSSKAEGETINSVTQQILTLANHKTASGISPEYPGFREVILHSQDSEDNDIELYVTNFDLGLPIHPSSDHARDQKLKCEIMVGSAFTEDDVYPPYTARFMLSTYSISEHEGQLVAKKVVDLSDIQDYSFITIYMQGKISDDEFYKQLVESKPESDRTAELLASTVGTEVSDQELDSLRELLASSEEVSGKDSRLARWLYHKQIAKNLIEKYHIE